MFISFSSLHLAWWYRLSAELAPSDLARRVSRNKGGVGFGELSTALIEAPTAGRLSPIYVRPPLHRHCLGHAAEWC
jgi:hypothetical protein